MVILVTSVPILHSACGLVVCLSLYWHVCKLVLTIKGPVISLTVTHSMICSCRLSIFDLDRLDVMLHSWALVLLHIYSISVHNVPIKVVETRRQDANGNFISLSALQSLEVLWFLLAVHHATVDEARGLMQVERDAREDKFAHRHKLIEGLLAVHVDAKNCWVLWDKFRSSAFDSQSSLPGNLSTVQGNCLSYCLREPNSVMCLFFVLLELNTFCKDLWGLEGPGER